jgi:hypothetical protein
LPAITLLGASGKSDARDTPASTIRTKAQERTVFITSLPFRNLAPEAIDFMQRIMVKEYFAIGSATIARQCGNALDRNGTW